MTGKQRAYLRSLANEGKCVILVSHSPNVAQKCDEIYELKKAVKRYTLLLN